MFNLKQFSFYFLLQLNYMSTQDAAVETLPGKTEQQASSRIAIPPPLRKMIGTFSTFLRIMFTSMLDSQYAAYYPYTAPNRGVLSPIAGPVANPVAAPIINSGAIDPFLGAAVGSQSFFFPPVRINVAQKSQLYLPPGTEGRVTFILQNDGIGDLFIIRGFDDKSFLLQFDYPQYVVVIVNLCRAR